MKMEQSVELVKQHVLNKIPWLMIDEQSCDMEDEYNIWINLRTYGFECMLVFKYGNTKECPKSITLCIPTDDISQKNKIESLEDIEPKMTNIVDILEQNDRLCIVIYYEKKMERIRKIIEKRF